MLHWFKISRMSIIGIDIGGTKCAVVACDIDGKIDFRKSFSTADCESTLEMIFLIIESIESKESVIFGISCGGPLDSKNGIILSPPNLPGWDGIRIVEMLESRFGGKAYLMNDANAGALAEWKFGAGRGYNNVIFLTCGTGMGSGMIIDGRLYEGPSGMAGEIGHVRLADIGPVGYGKVGSFEGFCSGTGIANLAKEQARQCNGKVGFNNGSVEAINVRDVAEAARNGDEVALVIFDTVARYYGRALSILIDVINPEVIILGGVYMRCQDLLDPVMREVLAEESLPRSLQDCPVVPASLGEEIGDYAAISIALYNT